jgi:hypothetical protein
MAAVTLTREERDAILPPLIRMLWGMFLRTEQMDDDRVMEAIDARREVIDGVLRRDEAQGRPTTPYMGMLALYDDLAPEHYGEYPLTGSDQKVHKALTWLAELAEKTGTEVRGDFTDESLDCYSACSRAIEAIDEAKGEEGR